MLIRIYLHPPSIFHCWSRDCYDGQDDLVSVTSLSYRKLLTYFGPGVWDRSLYLFDINHMESKFVQGFWSVHLRVTWLLLTFLSDFILKQCYLYWISLSVWLLLLDSIDHVSGQVVTNTDSTWNIWRIVLLCI